MKFRVIEVQGVGALNLVAPVQGLRCRLKIEEPDIDVLTHKLSGFAACLAVVSEKKGPSSEDLKHTLSEGPVPFIAYYFGHFIKFIQRRAGCPVSLTKYQATEDPNIVDVFVDYEVEDLCRRAGAQAIKIINKLLFFEHTEQRYGDLKSAINQMVMEMSESRKRGYLSQDIKEFCDIATRRGIPWRRVSRNSQTVLFGFGKDQQIFEHSILGTERHNSAQLANNKEMTVKMLALAGLPVARQFRVASLKAALQAAATLGYPVVVKPLFGTRGQGITPNIQNENELKRAFKYASDYHRQFIVENHIEGDDHRLLIAKGEFVAGLKRSISTITGDGVHTVEELVSKLNQEKWRNLPQGETKFHVRKLDIITECLKDQGWDWSSVPSLGRVLKLHIVPNVSQGGSCKEIWHDIHPENIKMAIRAASALKLELAGIDFLTTDISKPYWQTGGIICEVNVNPAISGMFPSSPAKLRRLHNKIFEINFPLDKDFSRSAMIVVGNEEKTAKKIVSLLRDKMRSVGYRSATHAEIDGSLLHCQQKGLAPVEAVLWNGVVDVSIIFENAQLVHQLGLGYSKSSVVIVEAMPKLEDRGAPEILDLILKTDPKSILVNSSDPALTQWAENQQDPRILWLRDTATGNGKEHLAQKAVEMITQHMRNP